MGSYRTLKSIFHQYNEQAARAEEHNRRKHGIGMGMMLGDNSCFIAFRYR